MRFSPHNTEPLPPPIVEGPLYRTGPATMPQGELLSNPPRDLLAELETSELPGPPKSALRNRVIRSAAGGFAALGLLAGSSAFEAAPAAEADHVYSVTNTGNDGVWLHRQPGLNNGPGDLLITMPEGTTFYADCFAYGTPIGPRGNPVWLHGHDPQGNTGYFTDFYSSSHWDRNNTLQQQGLPVCGEQQTQQDPQQPAQEQQNPQPAESVPVFLTYNGDAAADWARANATAQPPGAGACTQFVSRAMKAGGMPQTKEWNLRTFDPGFEDGDIKRRSVAAWVAPKLIEYLRKQPYTEYYSLPISQNDVPAAQNGDIIAYDWTGDGTLDHLALVVGHANDNSNYPLVAEWGVEGSKPVTYNERGWTWSKKNNTWLQMYKDDEGNYPHKNIKTYLLHIRREADLNVSN